MLFKIFNNISLTNNELKVLSEEINSSLSSLIDQIETYDIENIPDYSVDMEHYEYLVWRHLTLTQIYHKIWEKLS